METTEDTYFKKFKTKYAAISMPILELISGHWIAKCKKFKRPILRANYKKILTEDKYGKYDKLKKAFNLRDKYMNPRKSTRITLDSLK